MLAHFAPGADVPSSGSLLGGVVGVVIVLMLANAARAQIAIEISRMVWSVVAASPFQMENMNPKVKFIKTNPKKVRSRQQRVSEIIARANAIHTP